MIDLGRETLDPNAVKEITIAKSAKPITMKQQLKLEKEREGLFFTP
jgi:hypothetical protein